MLRRCRCSRGSASVIAVPPLPARPGAPDAMEVHLRRRRHVVVDDVRDVLDVEAASRDVGGDQQVRLLRPEQTHHAIALLLHHAAVQPLGPMAVRVARFDQRLDLEPRAAEDERGDGILHVEDPLERRRLLRAADDVGDLPHARHLARRLLLARNRDARGILQMPPGNRQNARGHRRREERGLPRRRRRLENRVEIFGESHVEHLVRFVEHEHVKPVELQRAAPDVIERAARRRDDHLRAALELADLPVHRCAAVDRQHRQPDTLRVLVHRLGHLHRQLTSRHENQPCGLRADCASPALMRCSIGSAKAAVLPVPVAACPSRSLPSSSSGIVSRWTGVGSS